MFKENLRAGCVIFALLMTFSVHAEISFQDLEYSSETELKKMLAQAEESDRGRIHLFISRINLDRDPSATRRHLQIADALIEVDDLAARSYIATTQCWRDLRFADLSKARQRCAQGMEIAETSGDLWAKTKAYGTNSMLFYQVGDLQKAEAFGRSALNSSRILGNAELIATQYNTLGLVSRAQGRFQQASEFFSSGLALINVDANVEIYRILSFNVGIAYADLGQHVIAQDFYRKPYEWAVETQRYSKELTALVYIAISDNALGNHEQVLETLTNALERPELRENNGYLAFAYAVLGEAYISMGKNAEALEIFERGMRIILSDPNTFEQRRVKTGYARALYETGAINAATTSLAATIDQLRRENARTELLSALDLMGEIEESQGHFQSSLIVNKEAAAITRDFQKQAFEHQLATVRGQFELDEKDRELAKARQNTIIRNGLILLLAALAYIAYLGISRRIQRQKAEAEAKHADQLEMVVLERTRELEAKIEQANIAESARLALERQLSEAEKLRVLGQLTGGVAHDFNNLLTVVIGAAELLKESLPPEQSHEELIQHIIDAATSGSDITQALMAYARKQPLKLETVSLNDTLKQRIPLVTRTLGGMVNVVLDVDNVPPLEVVLDSSQLVSAILNLALNARDAQNSQGDIRIRLDQRDGRWAVISVIDTGCGMTEEQIQRAVEPFYTTKDETHGNGLGLSMVYGFSKQLGGDLEIESKIAQGTTVRLVLPLAFLADSRVYEVDFSRGKA